MIKKSQVPTKASYVDVHSYFRFIQWLVILATINLANDMNDCMCGCNISERIRFTCFHVFVIVCNPGRILLKQSMQSLCEV